MKNSSPLATLLFLGLATAVGGAAWLLSGTETDDGVAAPIERPAAQASGVGFLDVSPREQRKKANLEAAKRNLKRIEQVGTQLGPSLYMIPDSSGDPTYYSTEMIEGRGRNGEPLFMTAEFKKVHTAPLKDAKEITRPAKGRLNPNVPVPTLSFGKATEGSGGESGGAGLSGAGGGGGSDGSGGSSSGGTGSTGPGGGQDG